MTMRLGLILVLCSLAALPLQAADRIIGAAAPGGGALLVKHFAVPAGTRIAGLTFVSNDLRTVFPKVMLLHGQARRLSEAEVLLEFTNVGGSISHHITRSCQTLHLDAPADLYVAITMPPSDGEVGYGVGAGIPATQLDTSVDCYFASNMDSDLGPMDVDYHIQLVLEQQVDKANAAPSVSEQVRPVTFLRAGSPNPTSGSTVVTFGLEKVGWAELAVYDVAGRRVRVLAHERLGAGMHMRDWDGRDGNGRRVAAGIYFVCLVAPEKTLMQKLVMTK